MSQRHADIWSHLGHYLADPYIWPWSPNGDSHGHEWSTSAYFVQCQLPPPHPPFWDSSYPWSRPCVWSKVKVTFEALNSIAKRRLCNEWDLSSTVNMDKFGENDIIWKSRGDGHCFVYSIVNSHNSQHPENQPLNTQSVFDLFKSETMNDMSVYTPYIRNESPKVLIQEMEEYIIHKRYKSLYGDNVPIIVSRALCMNVAIVSNFGSKPECLLIKPIDDQNVLKRVWIFKKGEHYDVSTQRKCVAWFY